MCVFYSEKRVGNVYSKTKSFVEYVRRALRRLELDESKVKCSGLLLKSKGKCFRTPKNKKNFYEDVARQRELRVPLRTWMLRFCDWRHSQIRHIKLFTPALSAAFRRGHPGLP